MIELQSGKMFDMIKQKIRGENYNMSIQGAWKEKTVIKVKEPKRYKVVMYNDDFTPMDFVVDILMEVFHKEEPEAVSLMYCVHENGFAAIGVYSLDIANTKVQMVIERARKEGYPLRVKAEQA